MAKHENKVNEKKIILNIILGIFIIGIIISSIYFIKWFKDIRENKKISNKVSEAITQNTTTDSELSYNIDFNKLKEINNNIVAYIKVNGTDIEYPIVQYKDNSYYLNRNLNKDYSSSGSIFLDYKNKLDGTDKNIVIYGHNVKDGSMFGSLKKTLKEDWYSNEENYIIDFITENCEENYQVFSVYQIETEDYYINTEFKDEEFKNFVNTLKKRSKKDFGVEITEEDSILTLSTCANNYRDRIVLHAKKITK